MPPSLGRALLVLPLGCGLPSRALAQQFQTLDTWGYSGQSGWPGIFGATCTGDVQSPVDVNTSKMLDGGSPELLRFSGGHKLGPLIWSYLNGTVRAVPSLAQGTWSVQLEAPFDSNTKTVYFGFDFHLKSLVLHSPSENTVDGQHYDMEVQLLHEPAPGQAAKHRLVTSVMLRVVDGDAASAPNGFLQGLREGYTGGSAAPVPDAAAGIVLGNPYEFLYPTDRSYYHFNGSLTAPPCSPAVWVVFATPVEISAEQLQYFRRTADTVRPTRLHYAANEPAPAGVSCPSGCPTLGYTWNRSWGMNVRDVQPMGSRWVKHVKMSNVPAAGTSSGLSGLEWFWWAVVGLAVLLLAGGTIALAEKDARESRGEQEDGRVGGGEEGRAPDVQSARKLLLQSDPGLAYPDYRH